MKLLKNEKRCIYKLTSGETCIMFNGKNKREIKAFLDKYKDYVTSTGISINLDDLEEGDYFVVDHDYKTYYWFGEPSFKSMYEVVD